MFLNNNKIHLHEAIQVVLQDSRVPLTTAEIAAEINKRGIYKKRGKEPINSKQVAARINNRKDLFFREGRNIFLANKKYEQDVIYMDMPFEGFLKTLFGAQSFHGSTGPKTVSEWKAIIQKVLEFVEKSLLFTIEVVDKEHQKQLYQHIDRLKESISQATSNKKVCEEAILGLFKLVFNLIGGIPDNYRRKKLNHPSHWQINKYRQVLYIQDYEHKTNLIFRDARNQANNNQKTDYLTQIQHKFYNLNGDHQKFMLWFMQAYPDDYERI